MSAEAEKHYGPTRNNPDRPAAQQEIISSLEYFVSLDEPNTSRAVFAAHRHGVSAWREIDQDGRLGVTSRSEPSGFNLRLLSSSFPVLFIL